MSTDSNLFFQVSKKDMRKYPSSILRNAFQDNHFKSSWKICFPQNILPRKVCDHRMMLELSKCQDGRDQQRC